MRAARGSSVARGARSRRRLPRSAGRRACRTRPSSSRSRSGRARDSSRPLRRAVRLLAAARAVAIELVLVADEIEGMPPGDLVLQVLDPRLLELRDDAAVE